MHKTYFDEVNFNNLVLWPVLFVLTLGRLGSKIGISVDLTLVYTH